MTEPPPLLEPDGPRWYLGFTLLSLDRAEPLLADMALEISSPGSLQAIARRFVERYQALDDDGDVGDEERRFRRRRLATDTVDELTRLLGRDDGLRVVDWLARTLPFDAPAVAGSVVRRRALGLLARTGPDPGRTAVTPDGREILTRAVARYGETTARVRSRLRDVRAAALSTWDDQVSGTYTPDADVMDWVADILENVAAATTWNHLMTSLAPLDREWLIGCARREAARVGADPDDLDLMVTPT